MPRFKDLTGRRFGRLTVESYLPRKGYKHLEWICLCSCGNRTHVDGTKLVNSWTQSCGCYKIDRIKETQTMHGESKKTVEYQTWLSIKQRCTNPASKSFIWYGGRGIRVCHRWGSFKNFLADMGRRPRGCTIERKNVNGPYSPSNCVWASNKEQGRNRRNNVIVRFKGKPMTLVEASELSGIKFGTLSRRVREGWSESELFDAVQPWGR